MDLGAALALPVAWAPLKNPDAWIFRTLDQTFWRAIMALRGMAFAIGAALMIAAALTSSRERSWPLRWRLWGLVWRNIFPIYLFHMPMLLVGAVVTYRTTDTAALSQTTLWHIWSVFFVTVAATLALSLPLGRYFEQSLQRVLRTRFLS